MTQLHHHESPSQHFLFDTQLLFAQLERRGGSAHQRAVMVPGPVTAMSKSSNLFWKTVARAPIMKEYWSRLVARVMGSRNSISGLYFSLVIRCMGTMHVSVLE
jgi:hypothetical protein